VSTHAETSHDADRQRHALELGRLERLRAQLVAAECDAGVFYDPVNVRYATGTSNMQVYALHNPCRYAYVPVEGPVVLFDFKGCEHLSDGHPVVSDVRDATSWYHFVTGPRTEEFADRWAAEIVELLGTGRSTGRTRLAVDRLDPFGARALERRGVEVVDGQAVANLAKAVEISDAYRDDASVDPSFARLQEHQAFRDLIYPEEIDPEQEPS